jgi:flagellar operon protein
MKQAAEILMDKINPSLPNPQRIQDNQPQHQPELKQETELSFEHLLQAQLGRSPVVRFSAHAQRRLISRNITFGDTETNRLEQAVEKAAEKGSRASLILMDDVALIVSIKNKLVITAIDAESRKENIFTNIDSVVLT